MLAVVVLLLTTLGFFKYRQIETAVHASAGFQPPPEAVTTTIAQRQQWSSAMNVIGSVEAVQGVTVAADLPGTVARINFDSGKAVHEGDVLVELDTRQERAQLGVVAMELDDRLGVGERRGIGGRQPVEELGDLRQLHE